MPIISIDKEKKARFRKKLIRQITFVVAAIIIIAVIVFSLLTNKFVELSHMAKNIGNVDNFPIVARQHQLQEVQSVGNYIAVLTKASVFFYDLNGNVVSEVTHGFTSPVMKVNDRYCLVYDRGGLSYKLLSPFKTYIDKTTTDKILSADLSENGKVAIAQLNTRFSTYLDIVNRDGDSIYKWYSAHDKLIDIEFNQAGTELSVATVIPDQGLMTTVVYSLNFKEQQEVFKTQIIGSTPFNVSYKSNGNICVIGNTSIATLDSKGTITSQYSITTDGVGFSTSSQNTYLITDSLLSKNHTLSILNKSGELVSKSDFNDRQIRNYYSNGILYILASDTLYMYNVASENVDHVQMEKEYVDFTVVNGNIYLLDKNEIIKINKNGEQYVNTINS